MLLFPCSVCCKELMPDCNSLSCSRIGTGTLWSRTPSPLEALYTVAISLQVTVRHDNATGLHISDVATVISQY
jgi:hypothetical protein